MLKGELDLFDGRGMGGTAGGDRAKGLTEGEEFDGGSDRMIRKGAEEARNGKETLGRDIGHTRCLEAASEGRIERLARERWDRKTDREDAKRRADRDELFGWDSVWGDEPASVVEGQLSILEEVVEDGEDVPFGLVETLQDQKTPVDGRLHDGLIGPIASSAGLELSSLLEIAVCRVTREGDVLDGSLARRGVVEHQPARQRSAGVDDQEVLAEGVFLLHPAQHPLGLCIETGVEEGVFEAMRDVQEPLFVLGSVGCHWEAALGPRPTSRRSDQRNGRKERSAIPIFPSPLSSLSLSSVKQHEAQQEIKR